MIIYLMVNFEVKCCVSLGKFVLTLLRLCVCECMLLYTVVAVLDVVWHIGPTHVILRPMGPGDRLEILVRGIGVLRCMFNCL